MDNQAAVREALAKAVERYQRSEIAAATGITGSYISHFMAGKRDLGKSTLRTLESWLSAHGYMEAAPGPVPDVFAEQAADLEQLAAVLRSSIHPPEFKEDRFRSFIRSYARGIERFGESEK